MNVRQVGVGVLMLAASGTILITTGTPGGPLLLGLAGVGLVGPFVRKVLDPQSDRQWPV